MGEEKPGEVSIKPIKINTTWVTNNEDYFEFTYVTTQINICKKCSDLTTNLIHVGKIIQTNSTILN